MLVVELPDVRSVAQVEVAGGRKGGRDMKAEFEGGVDEGTCGSTGGIGLYVEVRG
jgi:hypothetical protein